MLTLRKLFRSGKLGNGRRQTPDRILIIFAQHPVITQNLFFDHTEIVNRHRRARSRQHIEHIHTFGRHRSQVIGLGRAITIFILSLGVSLNSPISPKVR